MSFTIKCNKCNQTLSVDESNVGNVLKAIGWGPDLSEAVATENEPIAIYTFYDMSWDTMVCKCGNKITE